MHILCIGDQIREGSYQLLSRFRHVVNYSDTRSLVSLADRSVGAGPFHVVMNRLPAVPPERLEVRRGEICLGPWHLSRDRARRYDSVVSARPGRRRIGQSRQRLARWLVQDAPSLSLAFLLDEKREMFFQNAVERGFVAVAKRATHLLRQRRITAAVRRLSGCGFGLTPGGDDWIVGFMAGLLVSDVPRRAHWLRRIRRAAATSNPYSRQFMDLALRDCYVEKVRDVLAAFASGSARALRPAFARLLKMGATSGADLATGLVLGVDFSMSLVKEEKER